MTRSYRKAPAWFAIAVAMVGLFFLAACTNRKVLTLGTHKVTVSRHGFEKRLVVNTHAAIPTLEYAGMATDGRGLKVSITGDDVIVNGNRGKLRPGDAVLLSDDGVAINSLDFGESERYLRANASLTATTAAN